MFIRDTLNILSHLTFSKILNGLQSYFSYQISRIIKQSIPTKGPISISVEPTTACNLGCPECPSGLKKFSRNTGNIQFNTFQKIVREVKNTLLYLNLYFQGEPTIHPEFTKLVKHAKDNNIYVSTSTNAHFLTPQASKEIIESGLDRIIISIDGTTQETYEQYRKKGNLEKVIEGTRNLIEQKKILKSNTPHIIFQFLVVKPNEHQIDEVKELANTIGVKEIRFKTAQVYNYKNGNPLIPNNERYSRYKKQTNGTYKLKNKLLNKCWRMWSSCVFTWDGNVVPCCFDKDAKHQLGDVKKIPFNTIWKSKHYHQFRKQIITGRQQIDICKNCSEGTKVWD